MPECVWVFLQRCGYFLANSYRRQGMKIIQLIQDVVSLCVLVVLCTSIELTTITVVGTGTRALECARKPFIIVCSTLARGFITPCKVQASNARLMPSTGLNLKHVLHYCADSGFGLSMRTFFMG